MALRTPPRSQTPELRPESSKLPDHASRENIKVSVRIRPLSDKESGRGDRAVWGSDGSGGVGLLSAAGDRLDVKFAYDTVFSASNSNAQVFDQVAWPAIEPVLQGVNGTVFAYGVTSSGKTHTMIGTPSDAGVVPRAIQTLFDRIKASEDSVYSVKLSMLEIYCEMLNDLLDSSKLDLDVQECQGGAGRGSVLVVKGLTEGKVTSTEEALALIQQGQENRKVASTAYNDQSSRSHTICRLLVESSPRRSSPSALQTATAAVDTTSSSSSSTSRRGTNTGSSASSSGGGGGGGGGNVSCTSAWLTLVDLAGSEGAKAALSKDQQAEARDINRSLLTLGKVMYELAKGGTGGHLPFRDSLLTRLLKPSLTGSGAKVAIICNVTPASSQSDETWNTLRFADGAKRIKITAVKNEALDIAAVVAQYQREVAALKAQLAALSGAAASAGGTLCPDVLHAIQATLDNSSKDNAADQVKDQAAQLQYLRECLSFASQERDQLLIMNKKMTSMLVQQTQQAAAAAAAAAGAAAAKGADSFTEALSSGQGAGAAVVAVAGKRAARLRRCFSYESLEYYSQWQGSRPDTPQRQQQQQQRHGALDLTTGLECNAADAAAVQELLRISSDELSECLTHGKRNQELRQQLLQDQQQQQQQEFAGQQLQQQTEPPPAAVETAFATGHVARPASSTTSASLKGGAGLRPGSDSAGIPFVLSKYYSAVSSFSGFLGSAGDTGRLCSSSNSTESNPASGGAAAAAAGGGAVVPCPIVFPGSRRTSKTLAVAVPGVGGAGGNAAGWLGFVGLPVLPEGLTHTALWEVVEAHKALAAQARRLELLMQQLADKEELLEQARQLQQGQVLQLRLTITAADRALLRDKLAEAEQQIASYQAQQAEYEQDLQDMFNHINQLHAASNAAAQEPIVLAARLALAELPPSSPVLDTAATGSAVLSAQRSFSRCSSGRESPELGGTRIPMPPGSPTRTVATFGGSPAVPASSKIAASFSKSVGSSPRKSAAASATFSSIKSSMATAASFGSSTSSPLNSARSGSSPTAAAAAAAGGGGVSTSMSPRLSKLASKLPNILVEDMGGMPLHLQGSSGINTSCGVVRRAASPSGSPLLMSRSNSFLATRAASATAYPAGALLERPGAASASFNASPSAKERVAELSLRDSKLRTSWGSSNEAQQGLGAFNPICITSPFNDLVAAAAAGPAAAQSPTMSLREQSLSATGESGVTSPKAQQLRVSSEVRRPGLSTGSQSVTVLQSGKQSRIPLPPFLKRQSKRALLSQHQQQQHSEDSESGSAGGVSRPGQLMDKFLLGLHGMALPQGHEQPLSKKPAAAPAAAAVGGRQGILALHGAALPQGQEQQPRESPAPPAAADRLGVKQLSSGSPFAAAAAAAAAATTPVPLAEHPEGKDECSNEVDEQLLSVKSHPVELRPSVVDGWSTRSSLCL